MASHIFRDAQHCLLGCSHRIKEGDELVRSPWFIINNQVCVPRPHSALREAARRGARRTTLTAAQRGLRPPEAAGVCGLSKTGALFLPSPWKDYQLHLSQKPRLNLLRRSRGSWSPARAEFGCPPLPRGASESAMAKARKVPPQTNPAARVTLCLIHPVPYPVPAEAAVFSSPR